MWLSPSPPAPPPSTELVQPAPSLVALLAFSARELFWESAEFSPGAVEQALLSSAGSSEVASGLGQLYPVCTSHPPTQDHCVQAHPPPHSPEAVKTGGGGTVGKRCRAIQGTRPSQSSAPRKTTKVSLLQAPQDLPPARSLPRICLNAKGVSWPSANQTRTGQVVGAG